MPKEEFDLIVIGTGSGGSVTAGKCAKAGWKVAQIDSRPFGGTCALRGCDPKKVLVGAAELIDWNNRMSGHGIDTQSSIDWAKLMEFKRSFTEPVPELREKAMEKIGITPIHGEASFTGKDTIVVNGDTYQAKHFLIATGAKPAPLPIKGGEHLTTSTEFLELDALPETIVFVGGGFVSFEFASIAARAGSTVHIIHRGEHPLENFDEDLVDIVIKKADEIGINIHLNAEVKSVTESQTGFIVSASQNGSTTNIEGDLVVHGAGRVPNIESLDLDKAKVDSTKQGIVVNEYLQSVSNPKIYATGDVAATDGLPLTPVAGFESHIVASNLLEGNHKKADYPAQPVVVFTIPPLAMVGLTEKQALEQGFDTKVKFRKTDNWYSYKRTNESHTACKTIINKENGQILGAHVLGDKSEEIINLFAMAINHNIRAVELKKVIYAYPSHASDIPYML
ncbi:dihydrolipoyl dehydrogenase family protein [Gracilimonas sediminicola]|uniref:dihydrolipoyl dehydrogenase family protein n=1 Tax=Gracilimonas sediminicola TaxID=2952158 RepID=UPI001B12ED60|nr:NAD(P)/FAD-dependent oxidoreductase [Balneola sp.]